MRDREGRTIGIRYSYFGGSGFELQSVQWIFYVFCRLGLKQYFKTGLFVYRIRQHGSTQVGIHRTEAFREEAQHLVAQGKAVLVRNPEGKV